MRQEFVDKRKKQYDCKFISIYVNVSDCSQSNSFYIIKMTQLFSDPPKVKDKIPLRLIWALGFTERLDCPVDANPPVTEFVWTKNGLVIMFQNSPLQQLANGSLLVEQVTQSDAGNYRCTAKSSVGYDDSEIMQVEVKGKIYELYSDIAIEYHVERQTNFIGMKL